MFTPTAVAVAFPLMQQWAHGERFRGWSAFIFLCVLFLIDDLVFDLPIWVGAVLAGAGIMAIFTIAELVLRRKARRDRGAPGAGRL